MKTEVDGIERIDDVEILANRLNTKADDHVRCAKCHKLGREIEFQFNDFIVSPGYWICNKCMRKSK